MKLFWSFRGASAASEPGIQKLTQRSWLDSGFGASRRPGMTWNMRRAMETNT